MPIYSLYGDTLRPTDEMLKGIDALVFDVQDAGVRFYTYTTTMAYCMEEAAKRGIKFYVLDRPNPLNGEIVEGPMLDADKTSFTAYFPLPVRYGLTIGELAQLFNAENQMHCDLHVIKMKNWHRNYFFENTGLRWLPPSPNLRTLKGSILYPGLEILQNAGVSVGRGTETPFEEFGAPWMQGRRSCGGLMNAERLSWRDCVLRSSLLFRWWVVRRAAMRGSGHTDTGQARGALDEHGDRDCKRACANSIRKNSMRPRRRFARKCGNSAAVTGERATRADCGRLETDLATFEAMRRKYLLYK